MFTERLLVMDERFRAVRPPALEGMGRLGSANCLAKPAWEALR